MTNPDEIPKYFGPTSVSTRWRGKIKCAYCNVQGWPQDPNWYNKQWWGLRHGENCKKRDER